MLMRKKDKKVFLAVMLMLLLAIIAIGFYYFGILQTIFLPVDEGVIQLVSTNENVFDATPSVAYAIQYGMRSGEYQGQTRNPSGITDSWQNAYFANPNIVTINTGENTFRFEATMTGNGANFGLSEGNLNLYYCWQKINVYKNNQLIDTVKSWESDTAPWTTKDYFGGHEYRFYDNSNDNSSTYIDLRMNDHGDGREVGRAFGRCRLFDNRYRIFYSENTFQINVSIPNRVAIEGQNITVNVDIQNNLATSVAAEIDINFRINTLFGEILRTDTQTLLLATGNNRISVPLAATQSEAEVRVNVEAKISMLGANLQNLNQRKTGYTTFECSGTSSRGCDEWGVYRNSRILNRIESQDEVKLGAIISVGEIFSISPRPLYLPLEGDACPIGYTPNQERTYCVRDDIRNLTCNVLGCPFINGTQYQCTSAGICAETVFIPLQCQYDQVTYLALNETVRANVNQNTVCPIGTTCDLPTGFCVNSVIFNDVIQCRVASDCYIPCQGVTVTCEQNRRCVYSGQCVQQQYGCVQVGCTDGYTCNKDKNICQSSGIIDATKISTKFLIAIVTFIIVLFLISAWLIRKRR